MVVDYGDGFVIKRPLDGVSLDKKMKWICKQHAVQETIADIESVKNPLYNIPSMIHIKDTEFQVLEQRAPGQPLTVDLYKSLSKRQQIEIGNSIAALLMDMRELKPVIPDVSYKISTELKMEKFWNIISTKMPKWFNNEELSYMDKLYSYIDSVKYISPMVWSHSDLSSGNVLYDAQSSRLSFIDFADAKYQTVDHDIISPLAFDLEIYNDVYDNYVKSGYDLSGINDGNIKQTVKNRLSIILLKRLIKQGDDLRLNPKLEKTEINNANKVACIRGIIEKLQCIDKTFSK